MKNRSAAFALLRVVQMRLFSRLIGYRGDPRRADGQRRLWDFAEKILPRKRSGAFNQAMMELGSRICKPRHPQCDACPLMRLCVARAHGWQSSIPQASKKTAYEELDEIAVIVRHGKHVLLPEDNFADFTPPPETIAKSRGHHAEWIHACKTGAPTTCNFEYAGWLTEANHLGNVAYRTGKKLEWDPENLRATNAPEAEPFIQRDYRKGWKLI